MLARNFAENQEDKSFQNFKTTGQVQKRCSNVSALLLQNEQLGFWANSIPCKAILVTIALRFNLI